MRVLGALEEDPVGEVEQYTSTEFRDTLTTLTMRPSMGRVGSSLLTG